MNEGAFDRLFRTMLGIILLIFGWGMTGAFGTVLLVISAVLFFTAAVGLCPLYSVLGLNTMQNEEENS